MNNTSPFSFLESLVSQLQPPEWLVQEGQQRLVLLLNHLLMQEQEAMNRLARKKGSVIHLRWGAFALDLLLTPAGLTDRAPAGRTPDLTLTVALQAPWEVAQSLLEGKAPPVKIEGDVQLAAEVGWLADNLRWDIEEDLSRIMGDVPAHAMAGAGQRVLAALREFLAKVPKPFAAAAGGDGTPPASATPANAAGSAP
jgi:ubiquinone biosynthesis accessory factor UbiJ